MLAMVSALRRRLRIAFFHISGTYRNICLLYGREPRRLYAVPANAGSSQAMDGAASSSFRGTLDITASVYQHRSMRTTITLDQDVYAAAVHLSRVSGERLARWYRISPAPR